MQATEDKRTLVERYAPLKGYVEKNILAKLKESEYKFAANDRALKFTPHKLWAAAYDYFTTQHKRNWRLQEYAGSGQFRELEVMSVTPPLTVGGFCIHSGISRQTLSKMAGRGADSKIEQAEKFVKGYRELANLILEVIQTNNVEGAMIGCLIGT